MLLLAPPRWLGRVDDLQLNILLENSRPCFVLAFDDAVSMEVVDWEDGQD